jgi:hypothetical protein
MNACKADEHLTVAEIAGELKLNRPGDALSVVPPSYEHVASGGPKRRELSDMLAASDFVSLHVPLPLRPGIPDRCGRPREDVARRGDPHTSHGPL